MVKEGKALYNETREKLVDHRRGRGWFLTNKIGQDEYELVTISVYSHAYHTWRFSQHEFPDAAGIGGEG